MPYEVLSLFFRCSEVHESHSSLKDAAACFAQLTRRYGGDIPVHPISQQYIYEIAAIDRNGDQRNFSDRDEATAAALSLDPKSFATEVPGITTFSQLANMYYEASRLIPVTGIHLKGMFDHQGENRHFWNSSAGKGQRLAYAQQAAFTLELALKAYLEVLGKLASTDIRKWHTHKLTGLFNLLTKDERTQLEEWWDHSDAKRLHFRSSFRDFLSASNNLYLKWRYITDLKSSDLSIDITMLLSASDFLLSASDRVFRDSSPIKVNVTTTTHPSTESADGTPTVRSVPAVVTGRVCAVNLPDGFDPYGIVQVVVDSDQHEHEIVAQFYKRSVNDYFGLEGKQVTLLGEVSEDQPHLLTRAVHRGEPIRETGYTSEYRTLKGSIHDIRIIRPAYGRPEVIDLSLWDETYSTQVECFLVTEEEHDQLTECTLGDKVLIHGRAILLNGRPILMVGTTRIKKSTQD